METNKEAFVQEGKRIRNEPSTTTQNLFVKLLVTTERKRRGTFE